MKNYRNPNDKKPLGGRKHPGKICRRRKLPLEKAFPHRPHEFEQVKEQFLTQAKGIAASVGKPELASALAHNLLLTARKGEENKMMLLIARLREEAKKAQAFEPRKRLRSSLLGRMVGCFKIFRVNKRAATQSKYDEIIKKCYIVEKKYSDLIKLIGCSRYNNRNRLFMKERRVNNYKAAIKAALEKIFIQLGNGSITLEYEGRVAFKYEDKERKIEFNGDGGGGGSSPLYDYVVKLIREVKCTYDTYTYRGAWRFVKCFLAKKAEHEKEEKDMQFYERCVEAHRMCQDRAKELFMQQEKKANPKTYRSIDEILEGVWESCYQKAKPSNGKSGGKGLKSPPGPVPILDKSVTNGFM